MENFQKPPSSSTGALAKSNQINRTRSPYSTFPVAQVIDINFIMSQLIDPQSIYHFDARPTYHFSYPLKQKVTEVFALHFSLLVLVSSGAFLQVLYFRTLKLKTFVRVLINIAAGAIGHFLLLLFKHQPVSDVSWGEVSFRLVLQKLLFGYIVADVMYYSIHRVLHWRLFYRRIHRFHHETKQDGLLTALDVHPLEYVFAQMSTELMSAWMVGATLPELCFLSSVAKIFAMYSHSRSDAKAWISVMEHETHHHDGRHNFGVTGLMDWAFGTMK